MTEKKLLLDLNRLNEKKPREQKNRKMDIRHIKQVTIEFADGEVSSFDIPETQGFFRERYTYEQVETTDGYNRITNKLYVHEIHWTLREDQLNGNRRESSPSPSTPQE
jgi:hypothetical protein